MRAGRKKRKREREDARQLQLLRGLQGVFSAHRRASALRCAWVPAAPSRPAALARSTADVGKASPAEGDHCDVRDGPQQRRLEAQSQGRREPTGVRLQPDAGEVGRRYCGRCR